MLRSEEIQKAIKIKQQAKVLLEIDHDNRIADINRQIKILTSELAEIRSGKVVDEAVAL